MAVDNTSLMGLMTGSSTSALSTSSNFDYSFLLQGSGASSSTGTGSGLPGGIQIGPNGQVIKPLPTAPWKYTQPSSPKTATADLQKRAQKALNTPNFINESAAKLDLPGASTDYKKMFALYNALSSLNDMTQYMATKGLSDTVKAQLNARFQKGLAEVNGYVEGLNTSILKIDRGLSTDTLTSPTGSTSNNATYVGQKMATGDVSTANSVFDGAVKFSMKVQTVDPVTRQPFRNPVQVDFDLSEMGTTPRSMLNVMSYMNGKLQSAGVATRVGYQTFPGANITSTVNGKTIVTGKSPDGFGFKINGVNSEVASLIPKDTAEAVYVTQNSGPPVATLKPGQTTLPFGSNTTPPTPQLVKFQTDVTNGTPPAAQLRPGDQMTAVPGAAMQVNLPADVVRATAAAPDGGVYVLADVSKGLGNLKVKGQGDIALLKYDSTGNLQFSRQLGVGVNGDGLALAVGKDGTVAIGGSVNGSLINGSVPNKNIISTDPLIPGSTYGATTIGGVTVGGGVAGDVNNDPTKPDKTDAFIQTFTAKGEPMWTVRPGVSGNDKIQSLAFGDDGTVYASGTTEGRMTSSVAANKGGTDTFFMQVKGTASYSFQGSSTYNGQPVTADFIPPIGSTDRLRSTYTANAKVISQTGTALDDKAAGVVINGKYAYTASIENTSIVLRRYDLSNPNGPTQDQVRNLGDAGPSANVAGISIVNGNVVIAGNTTNGSLGGLSAVNSASGGSDGFVATLNPDLNASSAEHIAYYGSSGDDMVTGMTVSNGKVYLTGTTKGNLPGQTLTATQAGFVSRINADTGQVEWSKTMNGINGTDAPSGITVVNNGASVLDRFGLPSGSLANVTSRRVTANSTVQAGDQFNVRVGTSGNPTTITVEQDDTYESLANKVQKVLGYRGTAKVVTLSGVTKLQISASTANTDIQLTAGPAGHDALSGLKMKETTISQIQTGTASKPAPKHYSLGLDKYLDISTDAGLKQAQGDLDSAMSAIRMSYTDLYNRANPPPKNSSGQVPAYLKAQLANYQAGLQRLLGGG